MYPDCVQLQRSDGSRVVVVGQGEGFQAESLQSHCAGVRTQQSEQRATRVCETAIETRVKKRESVQQMQLAGLPVTGHASALLAHLDQREDGEREPPPGEDVEGGSCCWQEERIPDGIVQHLHRARVQSGAAMHTALL